MSDKIMQRLAQDPAIASLFNSFAEANIERECAAAKADPLAHKLTRVFDKGVSANYRFWACTNRKGQRVQFCYSVNRNAAGFYLGWREIWMKNGTIKRDQWISRRVKRKCIEMAQARVERARSKREVQP